MEEALIDSDTLPGQCFAAAHLPLATFDRDFDKLDDVQRLR
jgi:hypothetical protein